MKKKKRTVVFSLVLAAAMLSTPSVQAQGMLNLLGEYYDELDQQANRDGGMMGRGTGSTNIGVEDFGTTPSGSINVEDFGTPIGNGVLVLLAAGAGYAILKRKNESTTENN